TSLPRRNRVDLREDVFQHPGLELLLGPCDDSQQVTVIRELLCERAKFPQGRVMHRPTSRRGAFTERQASGDRFIGTAGGGGERTKRPGRWDRQGRGR